MPRVLMPGETDATTAAEKQEAFAMIRQAMKEIMDRHNTAFLNRFRQMMVGVFGPSVDKHFEQGESSATASGQPPRQDASAQPPQQSMSVQPTQHVGSQPIQQNPHQAIPNPRTYGSLTRHNRHQPSVPASPEKSSEVVEVRPGRDNIQNQAADDARTGRVTSRQCLQEG
jgi:hypothetical protein